MGDFWVTRLVFQRALALVYLIAFVAAANQFKPLLGERGLEPVPRFVAAVPFSRAPSLFYLAPKDWAFTAGAWLGAALSAAALLGLSERGGLALSMSVWGALYVLYLSFVNVGQTFYGFGWESILLEAGFYAVFLGPRSMAPPRLVIWLYRWLLFRVMFGAGLIKLRGDPCWRDLTCLDYYFETQPIPNPLSWYFHWAPQWVHHAGVLFNHFAELLLPLGYFIPGAAAAACGALTILFQASIMVSGNLSFLNLLTIVIAIPCLNDRWLTALVPLAAPALRAPPGGFVAALYALGALVAALSVGPAGNMASAGQMMNFSYNPLHLVGTYGAFGSITRRRYEIVLEGTSDAVLTPSTRWREYEFKGKPGDPARRPPQIAPYHLRLDWLMWFAAMGSAYEHPWLVRFAGKLLRNDPSQLALLRGNPFPDAPPRFVRARLYLYAFASPEERRKTGAWWDRELAGEYLPPLSLKTAASPELEESLP
jgi:hypothetical protein